MNQRGHLGPFKRKRLKYPRHFYALPSCKSRWQPLPRRFMEKTVNICFTEEVFL